VRPLATRRSGAVAVPQVDTANAESGLAGSGLAPEQTDVLLDRFLEHLVRSGFLSSETS
jgi:hypothetical protein